MLVGTSAHVAVLGGAPRVIGDTTFVMTPARLVVPTEAFTLAVRTSEPRAAAELVIRTTTTAGNAHPGTFETTFSAPFGLIRAKAGDPVRGTGSAVKSRRLP